MKKIYFGLLLFLLVGCAGYSKSDFCREYDFKKSQCDREWEDYKYRQNRELLDDSRSSRSDQRHL